VLLAFQFVNVTLASPIAHSLVTSLSILRQPVVVLTALAIRHVSISTLVAAAEPSEFEVYCSVRAEAARVARVEAAIPVVATDAAVTTRIGGFEPRSIIPPIALLRRLITPARLILQTLRIAWVDHCVEAANNVTDALCR
jgi:hypothetical protein